MHVGLEDLALIGYAAAALHVVTFFMRDDVRLRKAALCVNVAYAVYGAAAHSVLPVVLRDALPAQDVQPEWLSGLMRRATIDVGATLFRRGDAADRMDADRVGGARSPRPSWGSSGATRSSRFTGDTRRSGSFSSGW